MQNSCGEHHVTYISWQGIPFICVRWPVPFWEAQFTLLFPEKKSASDVSAPEEHTQTINSDEVPEKTVV